MTRRHVPYEKLSKKARREIDAKKRATWGSMSPVTRRPERPDAYYRNREKRRWKNDPHGFGNSGGAFLLPAAFD